MNILKSYSRQKGLFFAAAASVAYGMNPLFALPLYKLGFDADSVLFVRYLPAALILAVFMKIRGGSFRISWKDLAQTALFGLVFSLSSLFLFLSYTKMDAGIASTLLFVYPVMVAALMAVFFHERISTRTVLCIVLSLAGLSLLCKSAQGTYLDPLGIFYALLS